MASPEDLTSVLPETLPEDFNDWDGEASPAETPVNQKEWEAWETSHSLPRTVKQVWHSVERNATLPPVEGRPRASSSASAPPVSDEPDKKPIDSNPEAKSTANSAKREEWEAWLASHSSEDTSRPSGESAKREAISPHSVSKPHEIHSTPTAQVPLKQKKLSGEKTIEAKSDASGLLDGYESKEAAVAPSQPDASPADGSSNSASLKGAQEGEASAVLFSSFSSKNIEETPKEKKSGKKKWIVIGSVGASAILISAGLLVPRWHGVAVSEANQPAQQAATAIDASQSESDPGLTTDATKPAAGEPLTDHAPAPATGEPKTADDRATDESDTANRAQAQAAARAQAQAQMMNDQLNAPAQIPKQVAESGPPPASIGASAVNDMGGTGANEGIFNGHTGPVVKGVPPKPTIVSSGVATGMLIQKTAPAYPPIAKSARVSGTVELHATISKNGTVKDLSVVSGPQMLREAAVDAVRTWRYKPYLLNNQPTEVETTINVVFTLGG